jgi:NAD(P)-dependent dehydrogenase (short-subunit alcohol dehydrogenase family)
MESNMTLQGAQVVVIGGSSGIGLATAKLARQAGANITIAGRSQDKLMQAQRQLGEVRMVPADITNEADVGQIFEGLSRVDHVVVAAGTILNGRIVDNDLATLRRIIDERIWGVTYVVRHAAPKMSQGSITFTSGGLSSRPRLGTAMLTTALAGVEAMTPALALELAPVRVNTVTPGLIDTPLLNNTYGAERDTIIQNRAAVLPGKRVGTAVEVAQAMLMLMTNEYMTGEVLHIDGGGRFV